jgi:hypothetical protein
MRFYFDYSNFIDCDKNKVYYEENKQILEFTKVIEIIDTWRLMMGINIEKKYFVECKNQEEYYKLNLDYTLFLLGKN